MNEFLFNCNLKENKNIFYGSLILSIMLYLTFLYFGGFGWDGDSLVSASQFVKLINPQIYGLYDWGTHPKLLSILTFGIFYQISNDFVYLTFLSIALNSLMCAVICIWINKSDGAWWIGFFGIFLNINWTYIVCNCDNPAFSVPFIIFGLYFYFNKNKKILGAILILVSSLYRPGSEVILICMICIEWIRKNRKINYYLLLATFLLIALCHTFFGIYLAYKTNEDYLSSCIYFQPSLLQRSIEYKHSVFFFLPYVKSVYHQMTSIFSILFLFFFFNGLKRIIRSRNDISFILLAPLATLITPIGVFIYGVIWNCLPSKHMEYSLILPVIAAMNPIWKKVFIPINFIPVRRNLLNKIVIYFTLIFLFILTGTYGLRGSGQFEIKKNGKGVYPWKHLLETSIIVKKEFSDGAFYNALISKSDVTFFTLDFGKRASKIDFFEDLVNLDAQYLSYDIIFLPSNLNKYSEGIQQNNFKVFYLNHGYKLFIKHRFPQQ